MASVNIEGLVLLLDSQGGFITASNKELEIKYVIRQNLPGKITDYHIVVASFPDDSYKYLYLELERDGKVITFEMLSDIMYDLKYMPLVDCTLSQMKDLAELKSKVMRMSIKNYYYHLCLERRLAELARY